MSGLFIIAHAPFASALKLTAGHCFADAAATLQVQDVYAHQSQEEVQAQAQAHLKQALEADARGEVLILTDVFGATPCNTVLKLADGVHVKVVAGVNVPMLWRTLNYAADPLDTLIARAVAGGAQGIMQVSNSRPHNQPNLPSNDQDDSHHQQ